MIHKNIPNMIGAITGVLSGKGANIENMGNRSRGDFAYTIMDVDVRPDDTIVAELKALGGMIRVRVIE